MGVCGCADRACHLGRGGVSELDTSGRRDPVSRSERGNAASVFATENANGSPSGALWITNICVQIVLVVTLYANSTYLALFYIASTAILVPYVFSGAYALKLALSGESYGPTEGRGIDMVIGALATVYGAWLVYAAGPAYLLMCAILYAVGIPVYIWARRSHSERRFTPIELLIAAGLFGAAIVAGYLMWIGTDQRAVDCNFSMRVCIMD